ncbi:MAG: hypothetical protein WBM35_10750, partial [Candidatus Electrothrix sp.]
MSAICGRYNTSKKKSPPYHLQDMMSALDHYGYDGKGTWIDQYIALGHLATHISPESLTENQPIVFQDYVITADARLDNRDELCNKLDVSSAAQFTISDEKLILQAYQKWGLDTPCHLLGDFAFALWDSKEKHLFCARDYPGVRPFYYHAGPKHFTFASDIHGLLSLPDISQEFDEVFLSAYLRY